MASPSSSAYGRMDLLTTVTHELGNALGFKEVGTTGNVMADTLASGVRALDFDSLSLQTDTESPTVTPSRHDAIRGTIDWDAGLGDLLGNSMSPYGGRPEKTSLQPLFPAFEYAGVEGRNTDRRRWPAARDVDQEASEERAPGVPVLSSVGWDWRVEVGASTSQANRSEIEPAS